MRSLIVAAVVLLFASACGTETFEGNPGGGPGGGSSGAPGGSLGGTWLLTEGRGPEGDIALAEGYRITLMIGDGTVSGTSACNSYGGDVSIDGSSFAAGGLGGTQMGCAAVVMRSESRYLAALHAADTITSHGDELALTGDDVELIFERQEPVPAAQLQDTVWELESLIEGLGADGAASSAHPAQLLLHGDGTVTGTTGCRKLTGIWIARGDEIAMPELAAEGHCSDQLQLQDSHVVGVIGDGFTVEIEGDVATFYATHGGHGLSYRAQR